MQPNILALDFDGVICDGLIEYFASTKRAYHQIWNEPINDDLAPRFYKLRPVIETGWEMPMLLRALVLGIGEAEILGDWRSLALKLLESEGLDKQSVVQKLDGVRDSWIANDLDGWLGLHRFYPGVIERLRQIVTEVEFYIITTKEGRFVKKLLEQEGVELKRDRIIGKESKRPKYETLRIIRDAHQTSDLNIYFVEDRLKALQQVAQQSDLDFVSLFLADWGYNLKRDRLIATQDPRIELLSLQQFNREFDTWEIKS